MGQLIIEQIVSADGYASDRDGGIGFFEEDPTISEMDADQLEMLKGVDAMVFGTNTYRMFAEFWPTSQAENEQVAHFINSRPKHIVSSTLGNAPWGSYSPAIVERGDAIDTLRKLKARYTGDIILWGSLTLADSALRAGVVNRVRLRSVPVFIGAGRSFTPNDLHDTTLALRGVKAYPKGHVLQDYEVRPDETPRAS